MTRLTLALALVAGVPAVAAAEDRVFDTISMDRHTPVSTFGVDLGYIVYDEPANVDITILGLTIGGHYADPRTGFGGYLSVPLSYVDVQTPLLAFDSELALGNIEAGGQFSKWFGPAAAMVIHAGIVFPTADDNEAGGLFQPLASSPRYGDFVQRWPNSTWMRLGISPMGRSGKLFWRADLGLDLALDEDNATELSPVFRLNVGGGLDLGSAHLIAELVTNIIDDGSNDESASTLSLGARFIAGNLRPGVALILPLGFNEDFDADFALAISIAARL